MAYTKFEQTYVDAYLNNMYPDVEEEQPQDTMLASAPTTEPTGQVTVSGFKPQQVRTDVQPELGVARPIPQNKAQEALGYIGELLTKAGVQLDKVGLDIPVLGRISLKDLTVGESGKVLEDMALGFYPVEGAGGFISGTTRIKPDPALELLNIAPIAGAAAKVVGKGVVKGATKAVQATKGMPVGMSTQMVGDGVSELGFYSSDQEAVDSIQQPKGTGEQFLKQIEKTPGVKPEEIKWTGLDDFLKSKKSVTKAEVQEYLDKNRVEVKEFSLGGSVGKIVEKDINDAIGDLGYQAQYDRVNDTYKYIAPDGQELRYVQLPKNVADRLENVDFAPAVDDSTKFSKYTLPGGENYREILLTLPAKGNARDALGGAPNELTPSQAAKTIGMYESDFAEGTTVLHYPSGAYIEKLPNGEYYAMVDRSDITSKNLEEVEKFIASSKLFNELPQNANKDYFGSHFDQPNVLAHMRVNDRVDADGKKVLFVEEVQSDWHQAGRKQGYKTKLSKEETAELKDLRKKELDGDGLLFSDDADRLTELEKKIESGVPDAPFKTTWHELAMKRAIQLASEGGYDRVAFTTGKTQAARYDLSKQVKMISAMPDKNGTYNIYIEGNNGDALFRNQNGFGEYGQKIVTPEEFEELVGKDVAKTIMQKSDELNRGKVSKDQFKFYDSKPADLTIGGEGMKGFYDQILPKFLDKYAKKWDAKVGMTDIITQKASDNYPPNIRRLEGGPVKKGIDKFESVQYIDITPKMKESVLTKGQPLFAVGGAGAAMQQEDNK